MTKLFAELTVPKISLPVDYTTLTPHLKRLVREQYITNQDGLCHHCGEPLSGSPSAQVQHLEIHEELFPKNFFDYPIHLHHDHETGMTIGAVHAQCNAVLWQYHGE